MPDQLQLRGGTTVQHSTFTGASKEVTVDTTKKTAVVHDGSTVGGVPMMREDASNAALALASAASPSLKFTGDTNTGVFSPGADTIAISTGGTSRLAVSTTAVSSTLAVNVPLGAVGTPSLTFTGDLNTGIFSPGADTLAITTAGTNRLHIDSSGRCGIGTASPARSLHVSARTAAAYGIARVSGNSRSGQLEFATDSTVNCGLYGSSSDDLIFYTSAAETERARIDSSGRLLVGTSTSIAVLGVDSAIQVVGTGVDAFSSILRFSATAADCGGLLIGRSKSATKGTNTAVVQNDALGEINFAGATGTTYHGAASISAFVDGEVGTGGDTTDMPARLVFSTTADGASSPTERMRINASGNLMVGTANDQLNSIGAPAALTAFNNGSRFGANFGASTTSSQYTVVFSNPNGQIGGVNLNGTSTSYVTSSDYRLKENVVAVADGIARLQQLKPSRFNFIADPDKTVDGFLAHEVQSVVPEAINGVKDEVDADGNPVYQGIDQSKLVPLLTAALQEAVAKIESLEARLTAAGI